MSTTQTNSQAAVQSADPLMSGNGNLGGADSAPYVSLFQKAHQKIVLLDRVEEQLVQMLSKRSEMQEELRQMQLQINDQLKRRVEPTGLPARSPGAVSRRPSAPIGTSGAGGVPDAAASEPAGTGDAGDGLAMAALGGVTQPRTAGGRFATQVISEPDEER